VKVSSVAVKPVGAGTVVFAKVNTVEIVLVSGQRRPTDIAANVETAEVGATRNRGNPATLVPVSRGVTARERRGRYRHQDTDAASDPIVLLHGPLRCFVSPSRYPIRNGLLPRFPVQAVRALRRVD